MSILVFIIGDGPFKFCFQLGNYYNSPKEFSMK